MVVPLGKRNAEMHAAVRDAGGSFGVPVPLGPARQIGDVSEQSLSPTSQPALAMGDDGAAVVAWREAGRTMRCGR